MLYARGSGILELDNPQAHDVVTAAAAKQAEGIDRLRPACGWYKRSLFGPCWQPAPRGPS